jgi:hypothetical protein
MIFQMKNSNLNGIFDEINFGSCRITRFSSYKYLGLWIDDRLNYSGHISKIKSRVSPMLGVFHCINKFVIPEVLKALYFSSVIEKTWSFHVYSNSTTSSSRASPNLTTKLVFKKQHKKILKPKMCVNDTF